MATSNQIKKRHKYADKNPQIKKNAIRLNLGENNHIDPQDFDSKDYKRALAVVGNARAAIRGSSRRFI